MKIDLYTHTVLTIIAGSLLWIGIQLTTGNAVAQSSNALRNVTIANDLLRVVICHDESNRCADVAHFGKVEIDID